MTINHDNITYEFEKKALYDYKYLIKVVKDLAHLREQGCWKDSIIPDWALELQTKLHTDTPAHSVVISIATDKIMMILFDYFKKSLPEWARNEYT